MTEIIGMATADTGIEVTVTPAGDGVGLQRR